MFQFLLETLSVLYSLNSTRFHANFYLNSDPISKSQNHPNSPTQHCQVQLLPQLIHCESFIIIFTNHLTDTTHTILYHPKFTHHLCAHRPGSKHIINILILVLKSLHGLRPPASFDRPLILKDSYILQILASCSSSNPFGLKFQIMP